MPAPVAPQPAVPQLFLSDPYLQQFDYYMNVDSDLFLTKAIEVHPRGRWSPLDWPEP